jgi:phage terminase small subunit
MALTAKQEAFCIAYFETGNGAEAYRRAYDVENTSPPVINNKASALLARDDIRVRVEELRAPTIKKAQITVEDLLRELEEARTVAMTCETPQSSAAIAATMGKAKLLGFDKQVVELSGKNGGAIITRVERVIIDAPKV